MNKTVVMIARNGIIAALYFALTMLIYPLSFGMIQLRISEALVLLCFFRKDYILGLTIGCALVNLFSTEIGIIDVLIGSLATFLACLGIIFCKHLWVACLLPVVSNGLIIGAELVFFANIPNYWEAVGFVALGELGAMIIGYILFTILKRKAKFLDIIGANQNREFKC